MFTIAEYDLETIGRNGMGSIRCKIEGFWSSDQITLYIDRRFSSANDSTWRFTLSNSSGGRDSGEVENDMVAYKNYAAAMTAMCDLGLELQSEQSIHNLEFSYQMEREVRRKEREAEKAAEMALIDADTPLGEVGAAMLVEEMSLTGAYSHAYRRGNDYPVLVECVRREKTKYYFGGSIIAKKALIVKLAEFSARSRIPAELKAA
jgi:hypothetical protein